MKKISILIVNWNGLHHLEKCLSSIYNQTYRNFEIILVDNNSNDGSVDYIKENYPRVDIIELDDNYGFAEANNIAFKNSHGEYIAFLNNDTEVDKSWLDEMIKEIEVDEKIGFVASKMVLFDDRSKLDNAGVSYTISGGVIEYGRNDNCDKYDKKYFIPVACAGAAMYRRSLLNKIGAFDSEFFISYEDIDLSLRAIWAGYKGVYVPTSIVYHKLKASRKTNLGLYTYYNQRNNSYVWEKNMPSILKIKYIIPRSIYNVGSFIHSISNGTVKYYIKAKIDFFKNKDKLEISKERNISTREFDKILRKDFVGNKVKKLFGWVNEND